LETSKLQGYNSGFLYLGGVAARTWWRKLESPIRGIVQYAIRLRCFRKHKLKDSKGKEGRKKLRRN
jgi:hypothetical protein